MQNGISFFLHNAGNQQTNSTSSLGSCPSPGQTSHRSFQPARTTPTPLSHAQSRTEPGMFNVPRGGTATPTPRETAQSPRGTALRHREKPAQSPRGTALRHHEKPLSLHHSPGIFNVPQGWHCDSDTARNRSVSIGKLAVITGVASGKTSHDPHTVGTNERATPLAPRQVGVELVAQRTLCEPSVAGRTVGRGHPSHLYGSAYSSPECSSRNCERLTKVPPVAVPFVRFCEKSGCKG